MTFFIPQTRPLLEIRRDLHHHPYNHDLASKAPKSAGYGDNHASIVFPHGLAAAVAASATATTAPSSPLSSAPPRLIPPFTPTSAGPLFTSGNSAFTQFSLPPPMPHPSLAGLPTTPHHAAAAAAAAAMAAAGGHKPSSNGYPTPPTELHSPYAWSTMFPPTPFSPVAAAAVAAAAQAHLQQHSSPIPLAHPHVSSSLLSPAPSSYQSSTNSSREDLPPVTSSGSVVSESESRRR